MNTYKLIQIARQIDRALDGIRNINDTIMTHVKNLNYAKEQISILEGHLLTLKHDEAELEKQARALLESE